MRILIGQPVHEEGMTQLKSAIYDNKDIDMILFPEGYLPDESLVPDACTVARENHITIATSYRKDNKDRAVVISNSGELLLERAKTPSEEAIELYDPLIFSCNGKRVGYLLCMELLKGTRDLKKINGDIDFIVHPIGVGMFSEDQFDLWISEARKIALNFNTMIIGTSHADGSYRNCGTSIPISYCIDRNGEPVYISHADTRARVIDLDTKQWRFL